MKTIVLTAAGDPGCEHAVVCWPQKKPGWLARAWEFCIARPLTGPPKVEAEWTMVAEHSELRFIQRNGVFFEDNEGTHSSQVKSRVVTLTDG